MTFLFILFWNKSICYLYTSFSPIVTKFLLLGKMCDKITVDLATKKKKQLGKRENFSTQFRQKRNYFSPVQRNFLFCLHVFLSFSLFFPVFLCFSQFFSLFLYGAKTSVASLLDLINIKCYRFAQRILHGEGDQFEYAPCPLRKINFVTIWLKGGIRQQSYLSTLFPREKICQLGVN